MNEIKPGRDLDALVAREVFGCSTIFKRDEWHCGCERQPHENTDDEGVYSWLKEYSTEIKDAWEVVEKMKYLKPEDEYGDRVTGFQVRYDSNDNEWTAGFCGEDGSHEDDRFLWHDKLDATSKESAPHAICLAALKAVEWK